MMDHAEEEDGMASRGRRTARELKRCSMVGVAIIMVVQWIIVGGVLISSIIVGGDLVLWRWFFVINIKLNAKDIKGTEYDQISCFFEQTDIIVFK